MTTAPAPREALLQEAEAGVRAALTLMGEDPDRDGLLRTPSRVVRAWMAMATPSGPSPDQLLTVQFDCKDVDQMVAVGPVAFSSLCEHHLLPFSGHAWIAYLPTSGKVVGLSKLPRLVDYYAHRPQVQERLTQQVTQAIQDYLGPDAACVIDAEHTCLTARGALKAGTAMRTTSLTGTFRHKAALRAEFLNMVGEVPR